MTIKHQIVDKKQQANGGSGLAGGEGDGGAGEMSGLASQANALSSAGVGLPGLQGIAGLIVSAASVIAPDTDTIASLSQQIQTTAGKMQSGTQSSQAGIAGLMGQLQSMMSQLQQAMNPDGMKGQVKHHITIDDKKGIKSAAEQEKHYTTWDQNGVTHSSDKKMTSRAPQIPHEGNTTMSDNLNVSKVTTAASYVTGSDVRLKSNIGAMPAVLTNVMKMVVKTFDKRRVHIDGDGKQTIHTDPPEPSFGLIAQEVRDLFPELVHGDESKEFLSVHESKVAMLVLVALQEFVFETRREIDWLQTRLNEIDQKHD